MESFKYLGSTKNSNASCTNDIKIRIAIAKKRMVDLHVLWNDRNISTGLKIKLVKTLVWSALLYGAESWTLLKADDNRIMAAEMWFWRKMLKISRKDKRTNLGVLQRTKHRKRSPWKSGPAQIGLLWTHSAWQWEPLSSTNNRKPSRRKKKKRQTEKAVV